MSLAGKEVVLGVTGSIAAYKAVELLRELVKAGISVTVVMTESAQRFVAPLTFATLSRREVMTDLFTREIAEGMGDTLIKAGMIKCATGEGRISAKEEQVLRAAARGLSWDSMGRDTVYYWPNVPFFDDPKED